MVYSPLTEDEVAAGLAALAAEDDSKLDGSLHLVTLELGS